MRQWASEMCVWHAHLPSGSIQWHEVEHNNRQGPKKDAQKQVQLLELWGRSSRDPCRYRKCRTSGYGLANWEWELSTDGSWALCGFSWEPKLHDTQAALIWYSCRILHLLSHILYGVEQDVQITQRRTRGKPIDFTTQQCILHGSVGQSPTGLKRRTLSSIAAALHAPVCHQTAAFSPWPIRADDMLIFANDNIFPWTVVKRILQIMA